MVFVGDISNYIELVNGIINIYKPFISIYNWGAPPLMSLELSFCENSMVPLRWSSISLGMARNIPHVQTHPIVEKFNHDFID